MKELRIQEKQKVKIDGKTINTLKFSDDTAFCAEMEDDDRQNILSNINKILWDKYGKWLNNKKDKGYDVQQVKSYSANIQIDKASIEQIHHFNYLGSKITEDGQRWHSK